ncbi:MAG: filamentous hemagglutinin, partial [Methylococcaceae bacterium]|nr:filamentous hemagglutinin [Methylococcaceae bacterium]
AAEGLFNWNGSIEAWAANTAKTGRLNLAIGALATDSLTALNQKRLDAGFNEAFALSLNQGDLNLDKSDSIKANSLDLKALNGRVNIAGLLQSPNPEGGSIAVYGANGISLDATGTIRAADGHVFLDTVHRSDAGSGVLDLSNPGGTIDVSGSLGSGQIHLRAGRDANGNLASTAIQSKLIGAQAQNTVFEMTRVYEGVRAIDSNAISTWQTDTQQFMSAFKAPNSANLQWQPGIEIRSPDNLSLNNTWDFINWRYPTQDGMQTVPGYLTLRAPGKLSIQASITDALASDSLPGDSRIYKDMIQSGQSWNYTLVAGDNIELAPNFNNSGLNQVVVRTGTGSINLDSGHDIRFIADSRNPGSAAAIYTVGTVAAYTRNQLLQGLIPGLPQRLALETDAHYLNRLDPNVLNNLLRFGYLDDTRIGSLFQKAEFPLHGGDIGLQAAGNINGIKTGQKMSDWLVRSGTLTENNRATLWGINISGDRNNPSVKGIRNFNQNLGTLGGGNITVAAGGTVSNLSAMLPTTGKPFGTVSSTPNQWLENDVIVNGGGNLKISAGQNLVGGEYYVGKGQASLDVGGSIGQSSNSTFELGDAVIDVQARQNINIAGVYNPTVLKQAQIVGGDARFFSYDANSAINFLSVAGNITLNNNAGDGFEYSVYPSSLNVKALSGDISIDKSMTLFPDAKGQLNLLANNNIRSAAQAGQSVIINMSDADPSLLPLKNNAAPNLEGSLYDGLIRARERLDPGTPIASVIHAEKPIHLQDTQPVSIVANQGNIAFASGSNVSFVLPKSALFQAGNDIRNMSFDVQNLTENDTTRVLAGRDIVFDTQISNNGVVLANDSVFKLGGSGRLQVLAGQNINLGSAAGVETIGNILNTALGNGASIDVLNGLNGTLDIAGFVTKYAKNSDYQALLDSFVGKTFNDKDNAKVLPVVLKVLFKEIQAAATAAAAAPENKRGAMYQRGFDAIKTLLPDASYKGDLSLVFSQIKTLDSGDINILVPGGKVDVGLAGRQGGISKSADALGIVVQQQGNLSALANGNFNVNQSRVFTLAGGDLTVWSSKGSIDAGKGAKSAIAAPPPQTVVDEKGNIVTIFPPIVSGSGIQAVGNGLVTLAAPEGIVDAQEAGISGGQIVIAATAVVGASNISASGGTIGVPSSAPPVVNVSGADSAAANAAKSASQMTDGGLDRSDAKNTNKSAGQISVINADVIGFGDCSEADVRDGKPGCGG